MGEPTALFKGKTDEQVADIIAGRAMAQFYDVLGLELTEGDEKPRPGKDSLFFTRKTIRAEFDAWMKERTAKDLALQAGGPDRPTFTLQEQLQALRFGKTSRGVNLADVRKELDAHAKTLNLGTGDAGANLVPEYFAANIISFAIQAAPILGQVTRIPMGSMKKLSFPREKTSLWEPDLYWEDYINPATTKTETASPTFERVALDLKLFYVLWAIPDDLLQFTNTAINEWLTARIGRSIAKAMETLILVGDTGGGDPWTGIYNTSGINTVNLIGASLVFDDLINLEFGIDVEYWNGARYILNPTALKLVSMLKDGNNNYIWQPPREGAPGTIHGKPYTVTSQIPNNLGGADKTAILFGDPGLFFVGEGPYQAKQSEHVGFKENVTWWKVEGWRDGFLSLPTGMAKLPLIPTT